MKVKSRRMIAWKHFMKRNNGMETASRRNLENDDKAKKISSFFEKGWKYEIPEWFIFFKHTTGAKKKFIKKCPPLSIHLQKKFPDVDLLTRH